MTYFISDIHFGHSNSLAFDNKPFATIEEYDNCVIENWNKVIKPEDEVWILGDLSWHGIEKTIEILNELNGIKNLCVGNHDSRFIKDNKFKSQFKEIVPYKELKIDGSNIVLCHYPIPCYKNHYYGWYHLYGHVHLSFEYNMIQKFEWDMINLYDKDSKMFNVGIMCPEMEWRPKTLDQIISSYTS